MPRQPRLDVPETLHHITVRGIERSPIFKDNKDRQWFLERLAAILEATGTKVYACALIPNHFHLLLRSGPEGLPGFIRRLLTGYATHFNKRHNRSGHFFQNRYKSIVCEEEPYFLELVHYIHLNPLRAKVVAAFDELNGYAWSGHKALLGKDRPFFQAGNRSGKLPKIGSDLAMQLVNELGLSYAEIGRNLGITTSGVSRIVAKKKTKGHPVSSC